MAVGLHWGIFGVAVGYAVASFSLFYYTLLVSFNLIELRIQEFYLILIRPLLATLATVFSIIIVSQFIGDLAPAARLFSSIAFGTFVYFVTSLLINQAQLIGVVSLLQSLRRTAAQ
jgi:hypothetical protein